MKILQIHNHYKIRGGECSVVEEEYKLLTQNGLEVRQFVKHSSDLDKLSIVGKVGALFSIPFNKAIKAELTQIIKKFKPDVAHVHNVFPAMSISVYSALSEMNVPVVQTLHNYRFLCPNGSFYRDGQICEECQVKGFSSAVKHNCVRNSKVTSLFYAKAISDGWKNGVLQNSITRFIALNSFVKNKMIAGGIDESKIDICGNFIWENNLGISDKEDYIVYLGRLSAEKGVATLIKAVKEMPNVHLKIAGTGPLEDSLKDLASACKNIEFLGFVSGEDKIELIRKARCMVVPSEWYENFPISVVESMSYGTPVVASDVGGLSDLVKNGVNGLLFKPANLDSLRSKLVECHKTLENNNTLEKTTKQYAEDVFGASAHLSALKSSYFKAIS